MKKILVSGEVSINKLAKIASIATNKNQEELAGLAKILPCRALETLARDERRQALSESVHVNTNPQQSLLTVNLLAHLDYDLQKDLLERQKKGININQLLKDLLKKHDEELAQEKQKLAEEENRRAEMRNTATGAREKIPATGAHAKKPSRYIPAKIRRQLRKEHGTKCSIRTCQKPATTIHHTQRLALSQNHDPNFLSPLCREHHAIAHSIDRTYWKKRRP
ncbi:hypothetical protein KJ951_03485 [Patescibacteria group bacterium]|nr:hypothetical protein [Patescibacteria group bacterium]